MPFDTLEIRISLQKLLIGLTLVIVPLSFVGLYLASQAEASLEETLGTHFRSIAQSEGMATSQFINDRVLDVAALASNPGVVDAITAAQQSRKGLDDSALKARLGKIESTWETPQVDPLVKEMLLSPASQVLRRHRETDPRTLKILVADETGATVAATDKPLHYVQPNEVYWRAVYGEGRGGTYVSEIRYDDQTKANYLQIGVPVLEEGTRRFIGAVNALVDVSSLLSRFQRAEVGETARIMLLQDDGTVISAPNMDPSLRLKSDEYATVRDALATPQGRQAGYAVASMRGGDRIVGFADTGLKKAYPNLGWLVLASQDEREALIPLLSLSRFALLMVVFALLMLTLLTVYFFLHRRQRFEDINVQAAEEPPRSGAAAA
jgi:cache domain-containing protein